MIGGPGEGCMPITRVKFHHLFHQGHYKLDFRFPRPRALHIPIMSIVRIPAMSGKYVCIQFGCINYITSSFVCNS